MRWLAVAVIVSGWAWAGWANRPAVVAAQPGVFLVAVIASCLACWWIGRRSGRAGAVAVATARAEARAAAAAQSTSQASNVVNLAVSVADGARQVAAQRFEQPEWIGGPVVQELTQDSNTDTAEDWAADLGGGPEPMVVREDQRGQAARGDPRSGEA